MLTSKTSDLNWVFSPVAKCPQMAVRLEFLLLVACCQQLLPWAVALGLSDSGLVPGQLRPRLGKQCVCALRQLLSRPRRLIFPSPSDSKCVIHRHKC